MFLEVYMKKIVRNCVAVVAVFLSVPVWSAHNALVKYSQQRGDNIKIIRAFMPLQDLMKKAFEERATTEIAYVDVVGRYKNLHAEIKKQPINWLPDAGIAQLSQECEFLIAKFHQSASFLEPYKRPV